MTILRQTMKEIAKFIERTADILDESQISDFLNILVNANKNRNKILIVGAGRSALVGKAFAMRLMHLDFDVYVMGETITPPVRKDDVIIAVSGSGRTQIVLTAASAARKMGAHIIAITSFRDSPLARISDHVVIIPGRTKIAREADYFTRQILGIYEPLAPLGTLFEDTTMAFFDGVIVTLMKKLNITEEDMKNRHANVEYIG
ncbi:MAG: 6-phospho-3-hexuloisomerase [Thermoproteales archaeon]|nr:6-phospho-3-hexuloisomerase [Thermoproteales archaeon]